MEKESCLKGCLKENKNKCHSKLDLESHRFLKRQQGEILKSILQTPYTNLTGRGQVVKAAVQDDAFFYNNGFTLIELLVVVLIIGILAAVALPQYQKAVWKSRSMQLLTLTKSIAMAQEAHYLASNEYAASFDELDLGFDMFSTAARSSFGTTVCSTDGVRRNDMFEFILGCASDANQSSTTRGSFRFGPFYSAGFRIFNTTADDIFKTHQMYCIEPTARITPAGIFCNKIFGAIFVKEVQSVRYYEMP